MISDYLVTNSTAIHLKRLGFNSPTLYAISGLDGKLYESNLLSASKTREIRLSDLYLTLDENPEDILVPTLMEAQQFLMEKYKVNVTVSYQYKEDNYVAYVKGMRKLPVKSYVQCLSQALEDAVKYLSYQSKFNS